MPPDTTWLRVSFAARAGDGARASSSSVSFAAKSSKASNAAGKYSRSVDLSRSTWRVRSQIAVWCALATSFTASTRSVSPAICR